MSYLFLYRVTIPYRNGSDNNNRADFVNNEPPSNLHILYNAHVTRVLLEPHQGSAKSEQSFVATGVEAAVLIPPTSSLEESDSDKIQQQPPRLNKVLKARKEVIVSGGSYNSPVILMHSGLGPKEHLQEHGIKVKVDIPGVGSALEDHLLVFNFYQLNSNMT